MAEPRDSARAELVRRLQPSVEPALTDTGTGNDIDTLLDNSVAYTTWAASTLYAVGARIVPATRNGHVYIATVGGTSSATAPLFPTGVAFTVGDNGIKWQEAGADDFGAYGPYNLAAATEAGWLLRASKCGDWTNWSADGRSISDGTVFDHCMKMAQQYALPIV